MTERNKVEQEQEAQSKAPVRMARSRADGGSCFTRATYIYSYTAVKRKDATRQAKHAFQSRNSRWIHRGGATNVARAFNRSHTACLKRFNLSKTRIRRVEREWRHFVFESRFTQFFFWSGVVVFVVSIFTRRHITEFLMQRVFMFWFGAIFLYFASSYFLSAWATLTRRDFVGAAWMSLFTIAFGAVGVFVLGSVFA
jgi:hypothetical protein